MERDAGHRGQPLLQLPGEFMGTCGNTRFTDLLVKSERLRERPQVLESLVSARRHAAAGRGFGRLGTRIPSLPRAAVDETRNRRGDGAPPALRPGHDACPTWAKEPLVAACYKEVAAEVRKGHILDPKAVNAVHAQEHPLGLTAIRIDPLHR